MKLKIAHVTFLHTTQFLVLLHAESREPWTIYPSIDLHEKASVSKFPPVVIPTESLRCWF